MRLFPKTLLLLGGAAAVPLATTALGVAWRSSKLSTRLVQRQETTGKETAALAERALFEQARANHLEIIKAKAARLEGFFEEIRQAIVLETKLTRTALDAAPDAKAPPAYTPAQLTTWTAQRFGAAPYLVVHRAPGLSAQAAAAKVARLRRLGVYFHHNQSEIPWVMSSYAGFADGLMVGYPGRGAFPKDFDPRKRPWYAAAAKRKGFVWTDIYLDKNGVDRVITQAAPVLGAGGAMLGVAALDVKLNSILGELFDLAGLPVAQAVLVDDEGKVRVGASWSGSGGERVRNLDAKASVPLDVFEDGRFARVAGVLAGNPKPADTVLVEDSEEVDDSLFAYATVVLRGAAGETWKWRYVVQTPLAPILAPAHAVKASLQSLNEGVAAEISGETRLFWIQLVILLLVLGALAFGVAARAARSAVHPLEHLSEVVARVGRGNLEARVAILPPDEIGEAGRAINTMIKDLKEGLFVKDTFKRFVSASVVDQILKDPAKLKLGGEKRTLTVFFSDISGFTSISELLPPEELIKIINEYLGAMTEALFKHEGTLDKYEGDAVMAFWGAPVAQPDHALRACRAALDNLRALEGLWLEWEKKRLPRFDMRIGLNTGEMIVGNMGTPVRMDYTVMGDAVNLGARLESANKFYGTRILISESTRRAAGDGIEARELDRLVVKGKTETITVYELLGMKGEVDPGRRVGYEAFAEGLTEYRARNWDGAERKFKAALDVLAGDKPSLAFLERIRFFRKEPPPEGWDGSFEPDTK